MGRDLLYKPQTPLVLPDEEEGGDGKKASKAKSADAAKKSQLNQALRARDLGRVGGEELLKKFQESQKKPAAFKNAYFNTDVNSVRDTNFSTRAQQALRGSGNAADLKNVVLPAPIGKETPDPLELEAAGKRMGLMGDFERSMENLLGQHGQWAQGKGMTLEKLLKRMEELERLVALRIHALARMGEGKSEKEITNSTVLQAAIAQGEGVENSDDVSTDGRVLAEAVADEAAGMHMCIQKTLGLKKI